MLRASLFASCMLLSWAAATVAHAQPHRVLVQGNDRLAIVSADGEIEWEMKWGGIHDVHVLENGHIMVQQGGAKVVEIDSSSKIIIFSDSHRGDGSLADEFHKDRDIFEAALQHYLDEGYTLIEAGDNDELWEYPKFHHIIKANPEVFALLRKFHTKGRYMRIYGNHDMQLRDPEYVRHHLYLRLNHVTGRAEPLFDGLKVEEAVLLRHKASGQEILTVHGHQGDFSN